MAVAGVGAAGYLWMRRFPYDDVDAAVTAALGEILDETRMARGYNRPQAVKRMRFGLDASTLQSYEHGKRRVPLMRLLDICLALDESPFAVTEQALQRSRETLGDPTAREPSPEHDDALAGVSVALTTHLAPSAESSQGQRALAENEQLKQKLAWLNSKHAGEVNELRSLAAAERTRADQAARRAALAESNAEKLRAGIARIHEEHARVLAKFRRDARRELAEAKAAHDQNAE